MFTRDEFGLLRWLLGTVAIGRGAIGDFELGTRFTRKDMYTQSMGYLGTY